MSFRGRTPKKAMRLCQSIYTGSSRLLSSKLQASLEAGKLVRCEKADACSVSSANAQGASRVARQPPPSREWSKSMVLSEPQQNGTAYTPLPHEEDEGAGDDDDREWYLASDGYYYPVTNGKHSVADPRDNKKAGEDTVNVLTRRC